MRILLDESLPKELKDELYGHAVRTVQEMRWSSTKNGELLMRAAAHFDVLVTADQNLQFQQNLSALPIAVAVLIAKSNRIEALRPLIPKLLDSLSALPARALVQISG